MDDVGLAILQVDNHRAIRFDPAQQDQTGPNFCDLSIDGLYSCAVTGWNFQAKRGWADKCQSGGEVTKEAIESLTNWEVGHGGGLEKSRTRVYEHGGNTLSPER
jgi:hypothetical protein